MTAIGETLRRAREDRGLELDRVSEETRIARRFLAALEVEDFSVFPGDPYAIGFLRNYAEYLGLDANALAASYNTLRIQEQPIPIKELIPAKGPSPFLFVGAGAGVLALVVAAFIVFGGKAKEEAGETLDAPHRATEYRMEAPVLDKRLWAGDSVLVAAGSETWKIRLASLSDGAYFETPEGQRRLSLGEETSVDFDKDGQSDLAILLSDLDKKNPEKGANVRFALPGAAAAPAAPAPSPSPSASPAPAEAAAAQPAAPETAAAVTKEGAIFEGHKSAFPFVVTVTFRGSCMFRYEVDKRDRDERYYQKGDTVTINANNSVKLWASNAESAAVKVQASGGKSADIDLGGSGEVSVKRIAWTQAENGTYSLSLFEVD